MLLSDAGLKPYTDTAYHNEELKSLTRYRFDKVERTCQAEKFYRPAGLHSVSGIGKTRPFSAYCFCLRPAGRVPGAKQVANTHLTRLKALLETASNDHYKRDMALEIRNAAKNSIGSQMPAKSLELQHTIRLIRELDREIDEIEEQIQSIMDELHSPYYHYPWAGVPHGCHDPGRSRRLHPI